MSHLPRRLRDLGEHQRSMRDDAAYRHWAQPWQPEVVRWAEEQSKAVSAAFGRALDLRERAVVQWRDPTPIGLAALDEVIKNMQSASLYDDGAMSREATEQGEMPDEGGA